MPIDWIRVRHLDTGGETDVPERSLEAYARRGWFPLAEFDNEVGDVADLDQLDDESADHHTEESQ